MYHEAFAVLMRAFEAEVLDFDGTFYKFKDYLVALKPLQRPHPPLWYGAPNAEAVAWAAPRGVNVVSLGPAARARAISDRYRAEWAALGRPPSEQPMIGITRHIVVAETDAEARRIAAEAYPRWRAAMEFLWRRSNAEFTLAEIYPQDFAAPASDRQRHRRVARHRARLCRKAAGGKRHQLPALPDGVRQHELRTSRALDPLVRGRGNAGVRQLEAPLEESSSRARLPPAGHAPI